MGLFRVPVEIGDPQGRRYIYLEALVDSGASHLVVPGKVLRELGVTPLGRHPYVLADGREVEYEVGTVSLRLQGRTRPVIGVFGEGEEVLLGAHALETFLLGVDPVGRRLVPVPGRLALGR